jgi:hypothetical protein
VYMKHTLGSSVSSPSVINFKGIQSKSELFGMRFVHACLLVRHKPRFRSSLSLSKIFLFNSSFGKIDYILGNIKIFNRKQILNGIGLNEEISYFFSGCKNPVRFSKKRRKRIRSSGRGQSWD